MKSYAFLGIVLMLGGCGGTENELLPAELPDDQPSSNEVRREKQPTPVVSISVGNYGQVVEFYDMQDFALISETGPAQKHIVPFLKDVKRVVPADPDTGGRNLVEIFRALRPDLPVPEALVALEERLANMPRPERAPTVVAREVSEPIETAGELASSRRPGVSHTQAPQGCNNGCCDPNWQPYCTLGCDWDWLHFNVGWSETADSGWIGVRVDAGVCAAIGTTFWDFTYCSNGCVATGWEVPEATWRTVSWYSGYWSGSWHLWSNWEGGYNALHTHCGHGVVNGC